LLFALTIGVVIAGSASAQVTVTDTLAVADYVEAMAVPLAAVCGAVMAIAMGVKVGRIGLKFLGLIK
jgi:hypothetical protein